MNWSVVLLKKETVQFLKGRLFEASFGISDAAKMPGLSHGTESRYTRKVLFATKAFVFANEDVEVEFKIMTDAKEKGIFIDRGVEPRENLFQRDSEFFGGAIRNAMFGDRTRKAAETVWLNDEVLNGNLLPLFITNQPTNRDDAGARGHARRFGVEK